MKRHPTFTRSSSITGLLAAISLGWAAAASHAHEGTHPTSPTTPTAPSTPITSPSAGGASGVTMCLVNPSLGRDTTVRVGAPAAAQLEKQTASYRGPCAQYGDVTTLGEGQVKTFVQVEAGGKPYALGVQIAETVFKNLPQSESDGNNCFDKDNDGLWEHGECAGGHQRILFFPKVANTPINWFLFNWMPHGHDPRGIFSVPHFDMHFFIQPYLERNLIRPGPCAIVVNCDDFKTATVPVPARYVAPDYVDVGAVANREGNHILDLTSPEFGPLGSKAFTHTFIYGSYNGHITFWEPMITLEYLQTKPSQCTKIKLPPSYEIGGYYPTEYCIRYRPGRQDYAVTLEGFQLRAAN